jgi:hypothetical protein
VSRREFLKGVVVAGACGAMASGASTLATAMAAEPADERLRAAPGRWSPVEPPNRPIGSARGIFAGRVVWVHDQNVARWDGNVETGGWYEDRFTDAALAEEMLGRTLKRLTGAATDADAWSALFAHFNQTHGRGATGYRPGEKVVVKLNLNCASRRPKFSQGLYNTPQLTAALLHGLVRHGKVRPADIVVYDASRFVSDTIFAPCHAEFPEMRFEDRDGGEGRFQAMADKNAALHFGDHATPDHARTYLPACVTGATYMINAALMKGHVLAGATLCAKNHFGSVFRENTGPTDTHLGWNPANLHKAVTVGSRAMGTYNPLVDLMGHKHLGGKTMLYLLDGLYAAPHQNEGPKKWESPPFDGHWTASVLASEDPVAIESVAIDFLAAEKTAVWMVGAVDNYLHEAARADRPPSGTRYNPEGDGKSPASLGVHEHWNHPEKRQYSRNLGTGKGIELIRG